MVVFHILLRNQNTFIIVSLQTLANANPHTLTPARCGAQICRA